MNVTLKKVLFLVVALGAVLLLEVFGGATGKSIQSLIGMFAIGWLLQDIAGYLFNK